MKRLISLLFLIVVMWWMCLLPALMLKEKQVQKQIDDAVEKRADTTMDQFENGQEPAELAADKPAADETEKEDELVAAANVMNQVVVRAMMDGESMRK